MVLNVGLLLGCTNGNGLYKGIVEFDDNGDSDNFGAFGAVAAFPYMLLHGASTASTT
jgi:hypothetical protein